MGTGITLRWQLAPFACEFHQDGGQGLLLLRAGAEIIARETVASARMAYDRAADLVEARVASAPADSRAFHAAPATRPFLSDNFRGTRSRVLRFAPRVRPRSRRRTCSNCCLLLY